MVNGSYRRLGLALVLICSCGMLPRVAAWYSPGPGSAPAAIRAGTGGGAEAPGTTTGVGAAGDMDGPRTGVVVGTGPGTPTRGPGAG